MRRTVTWIDADGNRYSLVDGTGALLEQGAIGFEAAPIEIRSDERAADGAALNATRAPSKTLALPILFEDPDLLDEMVETFVGRSSTIEVDNGARVRQLLNVYYVAGLEGDNAEGKSIDVPEWWRRYTVELKALDPFWYGSQQWVGLGVPQTPDAYNSAVGYSTSIPYDGAGAGITAGVSYDAAIGYATATPYDGGAIITFDIQSRLGAWPVVTLRGPANFFQMLHTSTGQRVEFRTSTTLGAGSVFVIDARPTSRGVTLNGAPAWSMVTPDSDAAIAVAGGDQISFIVGGTDATSYVQVDWRQRWRMP